MDSEDAAGSLRPVRLTDDLKGQRSGGGTSGLHCDLQAGSNSQTSLFCILCSHFYILILFSKIGTKVTEDIFFPKQSR